MPFPQATRVKVLLTATLVYQGLFLIIGGIAALRCDQATLEWVVPAMLFGLLLVVVTHGQQRKLRQGHIHPEHPKEHSRI